MKEMFVGKLSPRLPVMQGALGYIGTASFAAAVARAGAMGTLASLGLSTGKLRERIRAVRELCGGNDIFGVNLLVHSDGYPGLLGVCIDERVDFVELAGGIDKECGRISRDGGPEVICKISSLRLADYSEQLGASAVTVMGKEAGGHLGFPEGVPFKSTDELVKEVKKGTSLTVIASGGAVDAASAGSLFDAGADGVQLGTCLMATVEFEAHPLFKQALVRAGVKDAVVIDSPFGMPLRALSTDFGLGSGRDKFDTSGCVNCISACSKSYCLREAIRRAAAGDLEVGVVPASENTYRINEVLRLNRVLKEIASASG
jgi:NAD(P)H-dependent flavin oxidoreductase YrpB (nitropropane dioxygenase family)